VLDEPIEVELVELGDALESDGVESLDVEDGVEAAGADEVDGVAEDEGVLDIDDEDEVVELGLDVDGLVARPWSFVGEAPLVLVVDVLEPLRPSADVVCASSEPDCVRLCWPWYWRSAPLVCGPMTPSTWMS
jgi:hypothetical protein